MERRLVVIIAVLAALALGTQVLVWVYAARESAPSFVGPPRSDYTLDNFTIDALDAQGQHSFSIKGPRLVRRGEDGSIFVTSPQYQIIDNGDHEWDGTSDSAWVNSNGSLMKLEGKVYMRRQPTATSQQVELLTSDLNVTSTEKGHAVSSTQGKTMETSALTTIIDPGHVAHGVGMQADLGLKTVQLFSDVHWTVLPSENGQAK